MSNLPIKRDEVHEINTYRPPAAPSAYLLLKWKPKYDMIVAGHILGRSNVQLAEDFDYTPVHIANILRTPNAQKLIKEASDRIRGLALTNSTQSLEIDAQIQAKVKERIKDFVENDTLAINSPFAFFDRVKSLSGLEPSKGSNPAVNVNIQNNQQNNTQVIRNESLQRIANVLEEIAEDE